MLPTIPSGFPSAYKLSFIPVALSDLKNPAEIGLEDLVHGHGKRGVALLDANVIAGGLFSPQVNLKAPHIISAQKVIERLRAGQVNGYVPVLFSDTYKETEDCAGLFRVRGSVYNWLTSATQHPFVFLEHDRRAPLPDEVRDTYFRLCKNEKKVGNVRDLSLVAAAIKIAGQTSLSVVIVTHDTDLTNAMMRAELGKVGVLVYNAVGFYTEITKPAPVPKKAASPAVT
jgi:hypothetical protein